VSRASICRSGCGYDLAARRFFENLPRVGNQGVTNVGKSAALLCACALSWRATIWQNGEPIDVDKVKTMLTMQLGQGL